MSRGFSHGSAAVVLCVFAAGAAHADVSAQDVWSDWRAYLEGTGYDVSGSEEMSGNTLTIRDTVISQTLPEDAGMMSMTLGELSFTENNDGTVAISIPATMPITLQGTGDDGVPFEGTLDYTQTGFAMVASGEPDAMTYNYTAASLGLELGDVVIDGQAIPDEMADVAISLSNVIGSTRVSGGNVRNYTQNMQSTEMTFRLLFNDPEENAGQFAMNGKTDTVQIVSDSDLPGDLNTENLAAMIEAGFSSDATIAFGPGSTTVSFEDDAEGFSYESSSEGGSFGVSLGGDGLSYKTEQNAVSMNIASSDVPLPISIGFEQLVFDMMVPVMESEQTQKFALKIGLGDFTVSDLLWGLIDPTGQLPRDPATIQFALSGTGKLMANVLDPMIAAQLEEAAPPGELETLTIEDIEVSAAGASLTGTGDFTFDNSEVETFDDLPRPTGFVDLQLTGANGLLDKLVAMGLLPEEQAGGARMMMGLFAVPGNAPDTLNSRLEINDQGHILANGQRIQ